MKRLALLALLMACDSQVAIAPPKDQPVKPSKPLEAEPVETSKPEPVPEAPYAVSSGRSVLWKRYAALERDLMRGLELGRDEVCREGERNCIRDVHLIALGGNDPFGSGIHRPPPWTLGTTPIVLDRVLLSACSTRAAADKRGPAKVFTELDLSGPAPGQGSAEVGATITTLFRRLLARDPKPNELTTVASLLEPGEDAPENAEAFAVLACFVVGSSLEFLFQ